MIEELILNTSVSLNTFLWQDLIKSISWQEWCGVAFSMVQVVLARNNNPSNYLFGIAGISLTLIVMAQSKLYAEFGLNIYYLVMSVYGWLHWLRGSSSKTLPISRASKKEYIYTGLIVTLSFALFCFVLQRFTDSDVVLADAAVSAFAWAGMWLMAKRKLENWILLNISNLISIPLLLHKNLYLYACLSVFLFIVAVFGYIKWRRILWSQKKFPSN
jgi:nicotinamide mononucleotide transporter